MGKGRDKRKKHEDPAKATKRAEKQMEKLRRGEKKESGLNAGGVALYGEEDITSIVAKQKKAEEKKKSVVLKDVPAPSPRCNAAFVAHPTRDDELVLFGGELWDGVNTVAYNDLYTFNTVKKIWRHVNAPLTPSPRSSVQAFTYKHYLIVHGGEFVSQSQSQFLHFRDTWRLNCNTCVWEELQIKNSPSARSGHRVVPWKRNAVLFGGFYDNALETRYYNDLWVLSDLDGVGKWEQVTFPVHAEAPHKRSGHAMAVHDDTVFIYGGYSTEKLNRFGKTEATVHHDLWCAPLPGGSNAVTWTKIKLSGIPPPIRSGVGFTQKEKKLYLFGGVVDIDAPGGKAVSSFQNDLFTLQLDTTRFYPLLLQKPKKKSAAVKSRKAEEGAKDLAAELRLMSLADSDDSDSDDSDDEPSAAAGAAKAEEEEVVHKYSHTEDAVTGQIKPCARMNPMMVVVGHTLFMFGGQFEQGKKEITLADILSLNLNRMESWQSLQPMELESALKQWKAKDEDAQSDAGSWEDGSTIIDTDEIARLAELDEDGNVSSGDDEDMAHQKGGAGPQSIADALRKGAAGNDDEDEEGETDAKGDDEIPDVIPYEATPEVPLGLDGRKTVKGKIGRKAHKEQLKAQLGSTAVVPSPTLSESVKDFFKRTTDFWLNSAREALGDEAGAKMIKQNAFQFCQLRYDEAITLMDQIKNVEEAQAVEDEWLRGHLAMKAKMREEEARREAEAAEQSESENEDDS